MSISVVGAGSWGAALAVMWKRAGRDVRLWAYLDSEIERLKPGAEFIAGVRAPEGLFVSKNLTEVLGNASVAIIVVPAKAMRSVTRSVVPHLPDGAVVASAAKGFEESADGGLVRMSEVVREEIATAGRNNEVVAFSGPSHAEEVAKMMPTTIVAAGDSAAATRVQEICSTQVLRIYTSDDIIGVELGGALKNPIAIAAGIGAALGAGDNALGALVSRGVVEIARIGVKLGADPKTFFGLSGIGDLVTTCASQHSRNRRVGFEVGRGKKLDQVLAELGMVAEGVECARIVDRWGRKFGIDTPIISAVVRVLGGADPAKELEALMSRALKEENLGY